MKKLLSLLIFTTILTAIAFGQNKHHTEIGMGVALGTNATFSMELGVDFIQGDVGFGFIAGGSLPLESTIVGNGYTTISPIAFTDDIYEEGLKVNKALYFAPVFTWKSIQIGPKVGVITHEWYQNRYDDLGILGDYGYYNITYHSDLIVPFYGGVLGIKLAKNVTFISGYDTFNEVNIGLRVNFN